MWWAEARSRDAGIPAGAASGRARRSCAFVAVAIAASLAAGCADSGFRPLYGTASIGGAQVSEKLAQVEIAPIPGRVGQQIRNEVIFQTTGGGSASPPAYRLEIVIRESITSTLVKISGDASGSVYNLDADFRLVRMSDKQVVMQGKSAGRAAFERFTSVFANVRARRDAENRAANTIAQDLKTRVAAYLAQPA
ncbi:MAG: LPS assembly lipoprotein LptE [Hyphomicrobiaceae bacterium]